MSPFNLTFVFLFHREDSSVIDAATKGALAGIPLLLGIIANIIAFVSAVAFLNSILSWLGMLVGYEEITFEVFEITIYVYIAIELCKQWRK